MRAMLHSRHRPVRGSTPVVGQIEYHSRWGHPLGVLLEFAISTIAHPPAGTRVGCQAPRDINHIHLLVLRNECCSLVHVYEAISRVSRSSLVPRERVQAFRSLPGGPFSKLKGFFLGNQFLTRKKRCDNGKSLFTPKKARVPLMLQAVMTQPGRIEFREVPLNGLKPGGWLPVYNSQYTLVHFRSIDNVIS